MEVGVMQIFDMRVPGWFRREDLGSGLFALTYGDGTIGIEHLHTWPDVVDIGYMVSPKCDKHEILSRSPLTMSPSILCSCGLHGFVRQGVWEPC